jgi:hypothetical protein
LVSINPFRLAIVPPWPVPGGASGFTKLHHIRIYEKKPKKKGGLGPGLFVEGVVPLD